MTRPAAARHPEREAALIDAAMTVQAWMREPLPQRRDVRVYLGRQLHCTPSWPVIEDKLILRLLAEGVALRLAA